MSPKCTEKRGIVSRRNRRYKSALNAGEWTYESRMTSDTIDDETRLRCGDNDKGYMSLIVLSIIAKLYFSVKNAIKSCICRKKVVSLQPQCVL